MAGMKRTSPWSVKGVDPEAREAAKLAARRLDMPVGQWLSHAIRKVATEQLRTGGPGPDPEFAGTGNDGQRRAFAAGPDTRGETGARPPALTPEAVLESINRLAAKIEESESRTTEAIAPVADKVRELTEEVDALKNGHAVERNPLERALTRMSERLDRIENGDDRRGGSARREGFFSRLFSD